MRFTAHWPGGEIRTYRNKELLSQATSENVSLEISLSEQRGLLLVRSAIAMDFPVATGKKSHPTPSGSFTIRAKEKNYFSNLYGKIYDAQNIVLVGDADSRTDIVPQGARFEGAVMPYWMRLTDSGVGLHVGYVPGRPASHGCIRLKRDSATEIFESCEGWNARGYRRKPTELIVGTPEIPLVGLQEFELLARGIAESRR